MSARPLLPAALVALLLAAGCRGDAEGAPGGQAPVPAPDPPAGTPIPIPEPDLSRLEPEHRERLRGVREALEARAARADRDDVAGLARAYGELGVLYLAAEFPDAAEACLRNAETLEATEFRWPYLLGHIHHGKGRWEQALRAFERALELRPEESPALVWLARTRREAGDPEAAEALLLRALEQNPDASSALFDLGKLALDRSEPEVAVQRFTRALELTPEASAVHYPLAMAYRALGDLDRAQRHLEQRGEVEIYPYDPWIREVQEAFGGPDVHTERGIREYAKGRWQAAADEFRAALEDASDDPRMHVNLGAALFRLGDHDGALARYREALRLAPDYAPAHYGVGALRERSGRDREALAAYEQALAAEPGYLPAHLRLGQVLRRLGRLEEAVAHFERVIEANARQAEARLGHAMALVRLGRDGAARRELEEAMTVLPDQPALAHALARLLVASPDDAVRDGPRALKILEGLASEQRNTDLAETLAMALAELGRYDQAAEWQRRAIAVAERANRADVAAQMAEKLAAYEEHRPWRTPWPDDHPIHAAPREAEPVIPGRTRAS